MSDRSEFVWLIDTCGKVGKTRGSILVNIRPIIILIRVYGLVFISDIFITVLFTDGTSTFIENNYFQ